MPTYYPRPSTLTADANFALLDTADPGAEATTTTGWTVGTTAATRYDEMAAASEVSGGFGLTALPDTTLLAGVGSDSFRTASTLNGSFAAGNWALNFRVIAVSNATGQDGRVQIRVFRSANANGSAATEITSAVLNGGTVTDLTTAAAQSSNITWAAPAITLTNEYLFISLAWALTGAATHSTADVLLRQGGANCAITTTAFTAGSTSVAIPATPAGIAVAVAPAVAAVNSQAMAPVAAAVAVAVTPTLTATRSTELPAPATTAVAVAPTITATVSVAIPPAVATAAIALEPEIDAGGALQTRALPPISGLGVAVAPTLTATVSIAISTVAPAAVAVAPSITPGATSIPIPPAVGYVNIITPTMTAEGDLPRTLASTGVGQ